MPTTYIYLPSLPPNSSYHIHITQQSPEPALESINAKLDIVIQVIDDLKTKLPIPAIKPPDPT